MLEVKGMKYQLIDQAAVLGGEDSAESIGD
jgi:hypothetical protein